MDLATALHSSEPEVDPTCYASCVYYHSHWTVMVWDLKSNCEIVQLRYPELVEFFDGLTSNVYQSDVARYLLVDAFGGLYLDTDITNLLMEC